MCIQELAFSFRLHPEFSTSEVSFSFQGTIGFEAQIDRCLELSEYLYNKIKDRDGYEMVFDGKVRRRPSFTSVIGLQSVQGKRANTSTFCLITEDLIGTQTASALCWMNAIVTPSRQCNVLLLCLMNSITACNCLYAYE